MEVLRPGVHFEEQKFPRAYVTVFTTVLEGMNRHAFLLLSNRVDVVKSSESYIKSVLPSLDFVLEGRNYHTLILLSSRLDVVKGV